MEPGTTSKFSDYHESSFGGASTTTNIASAGAETATNTNVDEAPRKKKQSNIAEGRQRKSSRKKKELQKEKFEVFSFRE